MTELKLVLGLVLLVAASGCSSSNTSLSSIVENPSKYEGETVVLEGELREDYGGLTSYNYIGYGNKSNITEINAISSSREIGNVDGSLTMVGDCSQNDYASKVKVEGEIKSYSQCNCNFKTESYRYEGEQKRFYLIEDEGARSFEQLSDDGILSPSELDDKMIIDSLSDFKKIDAKTKDNLTRLIELKEHFSKSELNDTYFDENGEVIDKSDIDVGTAIDYQLGKYRFVTKWFNTTKVIRTQERNTWNSLNKTCREGKSYIDSPTVPDPDETGLSNYEYDQPDAGQTETFRNYTARGCQSKPKTKYYLHCNKVVKKIE